MRGEKRKSVFESLKRIMHFKGSQVCAIALIVSMICGGLGNASIASEWEQIPVTSEQTTEQGHTPLTAGQRQTPIATASEQERTPVTSEEKRGDGIKINPDDLYLALQDAIRNSRTLDDDLEFRGDSAEEYAELLEADASLYELTPEIKDASNRLQLRVFARIEGEIPFDSDYEIDGSEEFILLLVNKSNVDKKTVIRVGEKSTDTIVAAHSVVVNETESADSDIADDQAAEADNHEAAADSDEPDSDTDSTGVAAISYHNTYRVMAMASPSDAEDKHTSSNADQDKLIEGSVYQAVLLGNDAVTAFVTTADELGLTDENINKATSSNADCYYEAELDDVTVRVWAKAGVLPEEVTLHVVALEEDGDHSDKYQEAKDVLDDEGTDYDGMLAYDISFRDKDDAEIEPDGDVSVQITVNTDVLPEEADPESLLVQHLAEKNNRIFVEPVADAVDITSGTVAVNGSETIAAFTVDGFSTFTITWKRTSSNSAEQFFNITVEYVDETGNQINLTPPGDAIFTGGNVNKEYNFANAIVESPYYSFIKTQYDGKDIASVKLWTTGSGSYANRHRHLTFYDADGNTVGETLTYTTYTSETYYLTVRMIYTESFKMGIKDTMVENGLLTADHNKKPGVTYVYQWQSSTNGEDGWTNVDRHRVTGDSYNISEDGSALNVAFDKGSQKYYRVTATELINNAPGKTYGPSDAVHVPYYDEIQNGSFEEPEILDGQNYQPYYADGANPDLIWRTTGRGTGKHKGEDIEIISADPTKLDKDGKSTHQYKSETDHKVEKAAEGTQFAELNAESEGALYQDVLTLPGETLHWSLAHRGRDDKPNTDKLDTMYVLIMSTDLAIKEGITTQTKVKQVLAHPERYPGAAVREISTNNRQWKYYDGSYSIAAGSSQCLTRFFFVAGNTASSKNDKTAGNHLDDIAFDRKLPPPNPGQGNLTISKTVEGLVGDDIKDYRITVNIVPHDGSDPKEVHITHFETKDNGLTYVGTGSFQGLNPGEYTITEIIPQAVADPLAENYVGPTTMIAGNGMVKPSETTPESAEVSIRDGAETKVSVRNTYTKLKTVLVKKVVAGNAGDKSIKFQFDYLVSNGDKGEFELAHGEEKWIKIPEGTNITVTEQGTEGYSTDWTSNPKSGTIGEWEPGEVPGEADLVLTCTNTKNINTPTGISGNWIPYMLMIAGAAIFSGFAITGVRRKKHNFQS